MKLFNKKLFFNLIIFSFFVLTFFVWITNCANIYFLPEKWTFIENCPFAVDIMINTNWYDVWTVWVSIIDSENYEILWFDYDGWVFASYTSMINWTSNEKEFFWKEYVYIMWTNAWPTKFNWIWKFSSVIVKPQNWIKDLNLKFYAIPNYWWDDSNIIYHSWWKSIDILENFTDWNYKFISWECINNFNILSWDIITKLKKNTNIDESKYSWSINQKNIDNIIKFQDSKFLFWLSQKRGILIILWLSLISIWIIMKKKMKKDSKESQN